MEKFRAQHCRQVYCIVILLFFAELKFRTHVAYFAACRLTQQSQIVAENFKTDTTSANYAKKAIAGKVAFHQTINSFRNLAAGQIPHALHMPGAYASAYWFSMLLNS